MRRERISLTRLLGCAAAVGCLLSIALPVFAQDPAPPKEPDDKEKKIGERLVRKSVGQGDEGIMAGLIRMMDEVSDRLDDEFDTGADTQAIQKQIMERLDEAIKLSAARKSSGKRQPRDKSDKRRKKDQSNKKSGQSAKQQQGDSQDAKSQDAAAGKADAVSPDGIDGARDVRRTWGHLPERERDEVIQGVDEEYLEAYRMWIERYYRALQESHE